MPSRFASATASGFSEMKESGPRSSRKPSRSSVSSVPPTRSEASIKVRLSAGLSSVRRCAAARPEIPPPMTTTRATRSPHEETAVCGANVVNGSARAEKPCRLVVHAFDDQLANHLHNRRVGSRRRGANHPQAEFVCEVLCFEVEVVNDFHVIGDEADRRDHDVFNTLSV